MNLKNIYLGTAIITTILAAGAGNMNKASADDSGASMLTL